MWRKNNFAMKIPFDDDDEEEEGNYVDACDNEDD